MEAAPTEPLGQVSGVGAFQREQHIAPSADRHALRCVRDMRVARVDVAAVRLHQLLGERREQSLPRREVVIEGPIRHSRGGGDFLRREAPDAALMQHARGRAQQLPARALPLGQAARRVPEERGVY